MVKCMLKSFIINWYVTVMSSLSRQKKKKLCYFSENAKDELDNLDGNFLFKTYLIIAGRTESKILSYELLSKINLEQLVFA